MTEFSVRRVDRSRRQAVETLGSKPKFWFREGGSRLLFKAEDRGTGEDWAEVVACHLSGLLGVPHATPCGVSWKEYPSSACRKFASNLRWNCC
jgi:hypothetical protein